MHCGQHPVGGAPEVSGVGKLLLVLGHHRQVPPRPGRGRQREGFLPGVAGLLGLAVLIVHDAQVQPGEPVIRAARADGLLQERTPFGLNHPSAGRIFGPAGSGTPLFPGASTRATDRRRARRRQRASRRRRTAAARRARGGAFRERPSRNRDGESPPAAAERSGRPAADRIQAALAEDRVSSRLSTARRAADQSLPCTSGRVGFHQAIRLGPGPLRARGHGQALFLRARDAGLDLDVRPVRHGKELRPAPPAGTDAPGEELSPEQTPRRGLNQARALPCPARRSRAAAPSGISKKMLAADCQVRGVGLVHAVVHRHAAPEQRVLRTVKQGSARPGQ